MGTSGIHDVNTTRAALPLLMEMPAGVVLPDEAVEAGLESVEERPEVVMASLRTPGGGGGRD
jgi:hypothetical protein